MSLQALKTELAAGHPGTGVYSSDDATAAGELNALNRTVNRTSMTGTEVFQAIDLAEFNLLTADQKQQIWNVLHLGTVNPFGFEATIFTGIFGTNSTTITTLKTLRKRAVSRGVELRLGEIKAGHVQMARAS